MTEHIHPDGEPPRPSSRQPRTLQYHDASNARPMPAGKVLVIGALSLLLAGFINADGLDDLADRQPVGWKRDVANAAVVPFCTIGRLTHLRDLRSELREAAGKRVQHCEEESSSSDSFEAPATTTTTPQEASAPPIEARQPTAAEPLRMWVGGDSMTIELAQAVEQAVTGQADVELSTHPEVSSGLTRPDFFDWPAYLAEEVLPGQPEVVAIMFGANDSQGMEIDGEPFQPDSREWQTEYRRRVGVVMDQLRGEGRLVVWIGQPHMRDDGFDERMMVLDEIYASEAEMRPWVRFLDSRPVLSPDGDGYQATADGASLRQSDGIHLDVAGADLLAEALLALVEAEKTGP